MMNLCAPSTNLTKIFAQYKRNRDKINKVNKNLTSIGDNKLGSRNVFK